jgi:FKBP-type peptidyl-prolyl cis-trans isomerase
MQRRQGALQVLALLGAAVLVGLAQGARESRTWESGLEVTITTRVSNCTMWSQNGDTLSFHYIGTLEDGTQFDSSYVRGAPFTFTLGKNQVIQGCELGLMGMCVGESRELIIPPALAYGSYGVPSAGIPGGATLYFIDTLVSLYRPAPPPPPPTNNNTQSNTAV